MDTTKKNIKMSEKAEEIQELWKPKEYDDIAVNLSGKWHIEKYPPSLMPQQFSGYVIWLPRQDQLQEMTDLKTYEKLTAFSHEVLQLVLDMNEGSRKTFGDVTNQYSMEQLWLAFVMHEKYGKVWNEEKEEWMNQE